MLKYCLFVVIASLLFVTGESVTLASASAIDDSSSTKESLSLIRKISGDKGFKINFEQKSFYSFTKKPRVLKGTLLFSPEKSFVWEIKGDSSTKIVSNGKKTWIYTPAEEEGDKPSLMIRNATDYEGPEAVLFDTKYKTSNLINDLQGFKVLNVKGTKKTDYKWLKLRLKEQSDLFNIESIEFEDLNGTRVFIGVKKFNRLDKTVPAKTFEFKAPKGTRIIE